MSCEMCRPEQSLYTGLLPDPFVPYSDRRFWYHSPGGLSPEPRRGTISGNPKGLRVIPEGGVSWSCEAPMGPQSHKVLLVFKGFLWNYGKSWRFYINPSVLPVFSGPRLPTGILNRAPLESLRISDSQHGFYGGNISSS